MSGRWKIGTPIDVDASAAVLLILEHGSVSIDELADETIADLVKHRVPYRGYGGVPQHEASPLRRTPVVRLNDGRWVVADLNALVEWAVDLPLRLVEQQERRSRRQLRSTIGLMFEAHATDVLAPLTNRHRITLGRDLDKLMRSGNQRPDALVANNDGTVAVECSLKPLGEGVAAADEKSFARLVNQYIDKATQARAVFSAAIDLASSTVRTSSGNSTYLLVTDVPLEYTPPLAGLLRELDPHGPARFVCCIEGLAVLVDLCIAGWSFPAAVSAWQRGPLDLSIRTHLDKLAAMRGTHDSFSLASLGRLIGEARRFHPPSAA